MTTHGPECVKTRSHREFDDAVSAADRRLSIAAPRTSNQSGKYCKDPSAARGHHARIAFITVSEPSTLITRFML